jgi:ATP-dependent Lhr-like helicase
MTAAEPLAGFSTAARNWFLQSCGAPTDAQTAAWAPIARGEHTLLCAPTGSGKTLAAFLGAIDRLGSRTDPAGGTSVVYVSPLRALATDVERNLRAPLRGIALEAERSGAAFRPPSIGVRTGDTTAAERRSLQRHPPEILITTPESLYLMLTSQVRETLVSTEQVIVDEIHALAPTKRGAHLALSLERLEHLVLGSGGSPEPIRRAAVQRIGLSATQRPLEVVAHFLAGNEVPGSGTAPVDGAAAPPPPRPVAIVDAGISKELDLQVVAAVDDLATLGQVIDEPTPGPAAAGPVRRSIWPSVHPLLLDEVHAHRSTLIFVNARRLAERLASRLNELDAERRSVAVDADRRGVGVDAGPAVDEQVPELVRAHHGSLSRERRTVVEDELKRGEVRGLVATSSLELGIDMGAIDAVVQVASPGSVASGLQRVGRAGHQVGARSRGTIYPTHRADLLECAVVAERMRAGAIEATRIPERPLDVVAQQIVAACALDDWDVEELYRLVLGAANTSTLSRAAFDATLDLLAGRYPSEEFAELRPRLVWDRTARVVRGRPGSQRLAVTSGGTIPDRGLYGVFLADGTRVGELDEEMVHESRVGEVFLLGASSWRIDDITFERVVVSPAPGRPGRMPFWHGDGPGRAAELGRALGEFVRRVRGRSGEEAVAALEAEASLDHRAATNVVAYLEDQARATGVVPDDRTVVVERFRDELGDWRVCIHSPFGARVHAPWAIVLQARLARHFDELGGDSLAVEVLWADDGIVVRLPEAASDVPVDVLCPDPDEVEAELLTVLPTTGVFAARFRECAARALLLPRRRPDRRTPLWQQRQRAGDLLAVASRYPTFPILLEATRECCADTYDLAALRTVLAEVRSRRIRVVPVETAVPSPFARSLLFGWVSEFMYSGDAPLAERRAAALTLDQELLRDLLGAEELRELLDAEVVAQVDAELQWLADGRGARDLEALADLIRTVGPLPVVGLELRVDADVATTADWVAALVADRRAIVVPLLGVPHVAAAADAGRLRDALGVVVPAGLPAEDVAEVPTALADLVERHARTHGPFTTAEVAARFGVRREVVDLVLRDLRERRRVVDGDFTPGRAQPEWCDVDVLQRIRRRSLAALRAQVAPVESAALGSFLPGWQGVGGSGTAALADAVGALQGAALPASILESEILAVRAGGPVGATLDQWCAAGDLVWLGAGSLGAADGRVRLVWRDRVSALVDPPSVDDVDPAPLHEVIRAHLRDRGASFFPELLAAAVAAGGSPTQDELLEALWDLVWLGEVTNDSLAPLRARVARGAARRRTRRGRSAPNLRSVRREGPPAGAGRWSLTAGLFEPSPSPTERSLARAIQLLERYGVLTREMPLAEGLAGGFAGVYPVLRTMEERGQVRRGYFVEGLGGAQFALAGAVDLLRSAAVSGDVRGREAVAVALSAVDPAQPYGASLPWPRVADGRGPSRSVGAWVVLVDGALRVFIERSGRRLLVVDDPDDPAVDPAVWAPCVVDLVRSGRIDRLRVETVDGLPAAGSPWADVLRAAGFTDGYSGLSVGD